jgi:hypothetical protein
MAAPGLGGLSRSPASYLAGRTTKSRPDEERTEGAAGIFSGNKEINNQLALRGKNNDQAKSALEKERSWLFFLAGAGFGRHG